MTHQHAMRRWYLAAAAILGLSACGGGSFDRTTPCTLLRPIPFISQPQSVTVGIGQTATFSVVVSNTFPTAFQWTRNGVSISGAVSATYVTPPVTAADDGAMYSVLATVTYTDACGGSGTYQSSAATLTVR